jgi:hypothetical protein
MGWIIYNVATYSYYAYSFINESMSRLPRARIDRVPHCIVVSSSSSVLLLAGAGQLSAQTSALDDRVSLRAELSDTDLFSTLARRSRAAGSPRPSMLAISSNCIQIEQFARQKVCSHGERCKRPTFPCISLRSKGPKQFISRFLSSTNLRACSL